MTLPDGADAVSRVRSVIERLLADGTAVARADGSLHTLAPIAISGAEGAALRHRVVAEGATRTIEIGLGYGISTLFIGEALRSLGDPDATHVALYPNQATRFADCGLQFLEDAGLTVSPPDDLHRWAVLRTPLEPDTRPFDHFVEF